MRKQPLSGRFDGALSAARSSCDTPLAEKWRISAVIRWMGPTLLLTVAAACAAPTCHPITIVVSDKQERARLERVPSGIRTTETGRLEEDRRAEIVRDYWVRAQDGRWYTVPLDRYRLAEVGGSIEVCR